MVTAPCFSVPFFFIFQGGLLLEVSMQNMVDAMWVAVSGALVFFMQPGFQMVESGLTMEKNSINVAIKNLTDIGISVFVYWLAGFALMFGKSAGGILGITNFIPGASGNVEFNMCNFLLLMARILSRDKTVALKEFLERLYDPEFKQSALESVNPVRMLEVTMRKTSPGERFETTEKKTIRFEFSRIYNSQRTKVLHAVVYANPVNTL